MAYIIPKLELPVLQYTPMKFHDELAMFGVAPNGAIIMFIDRDENLFVPWDEVVEYAAIAKKQAPPAKPDEEPKQEKKLREVTPAKH